MHDLPGIAAVVIGQHQCGLAVGRKQNGGNVSLRNGHIPTWSVIATENNTQHILSKLAQHQPVAIRADAGKRKSFCGCGTIHHATLLGIRLVANNFILAIHYIQSILIVKCGLARTVGRCLGDIRYFLPCMSIPQLQVEATNTIIDKACDITAIRAEHRIGRLHIGQKHHIVFNGQHGFSKLGGIAAAIADCSRNVGRRVAIFILRQLVNA